MYMYGTAVEQLAVWHWIYVGLAVQLGVWPGMSSFDRIIISTAAEPPGRGAVECKLHNL
jgi:hypothetical protein